MAGFDAVFVGSGINSLAGAALLAKDGWRVCVLERNDWLGGAIKTVDGLTAPGFTHEVFSSWHPLWVGSPAYAELKPDLDRARARVPEHRPADRGRVPGRLERLPLDRRRRERRRAGRRVAAAVRRVHGGRGHRVRRARHRALVGAGLSLGRKAYSQFGRRGLVEFAGTRCSPRATGCARPSTDERAHGLLAPWVLHTGPRPRPGDVRVHDAGDRLRAPARRDAGAEGRRRRASSTALATIVRDAGGELRTEADVERILVSEGRATAVRLADGETIAAVARGARLRHADAALRPAARRGRRAGAASATRRSASATAAARCRSTSR